jgi:hypothetical protein
MRFLPLHRQRMNAVPVAERFWDKVRKQDGDGCWEWTANTNNQGYGFIGSGPPQRKPLLAHRVSFEIAFGPIATGMCVLHRCDNPLCVRPDHLFLGTLRDNTQDSIAKGRCRLRYAGVKPEAI